MNRGRPTHVPGTLNEPAKELVNLIRRHKLDYDRFRTAAYQARQYLNLKPGTRRRSLPRLLTDSSLRAYFAALDRSDNLQHQIMLRILLHTAVRVSELCNMRVEDVDAELGKIFISRGKGDKDRYVLFPDAFRLTLRTYMASHPDNEYLFEPNQSKRRAPTKRGHVHRPYSPRRIQQIVKEYAAAAGIAENVHPHLFRHQTLTFLTKAGLTDAQIQLISGHASKKSLETYQHMSLGSVTGSYQQAIKDLVP